MDNLQEKFNKIGYKPKMIDTRSFGEKVDEFFNPILTPYINARPDKNRPQYVPEDIPTMEEDYSNTINLIKDIAKRADISQQTKSDQINRLAQRAQKQQAQILSMSAQPYENFSTYMTKRAGLAAQDLIMAPQRIGTAAGEAIGSFGESVITGKPYEEILAKNKKNRNELLYLSVPQIEQVLTKYGKGENLIKPSKNIQEFLANTNDMLRRERESQYEMGANLGEAKDVIIQGLMGSDYGKIEVPKEFETVAGISGFIFDAVVDPTNLLPGVGIGVSGTKAISRKALRTAISNADNMEDLITAAQKAVVNGVEKKEAEKLFYTRLGEVGKTPPIAPDIIESIKRPQAHEITSLSQISEIYQNFPESKDYNDFLYGKSREIANKQEAEKVFLNEEINKLRQQPESGLLPINNEVINIPSPKVKLGDVIRRAEAEGKSPEVTAKQMEAVLAENKKIEDEMNQMWEADEKIGAKLEVTDLIDKNKSLEGQRMEYYLSKIPVEPFVYDKIARNVKGLEISPKIPPANMGELMVRMRELNVPSEEIKKVVSEVLSGSSTPPPTIISKKPASVSVLDEAVEPITPTAPVEPVTDSITPPVETIQQAVTPEASQIPAEIPMQGVTPSVFADVSSSVVVKKTPKDFNAREMVVAKIPTTAGERNMVGIISDEGVFKPILSADREFYRSHRRKYGIKEIKWESMGKKFNLERARLWEYSQEEFFDIEGGLPFKVDRRKIIEDALIFGEDVPNNVLEDFPSLAREYGYTVEGVPNDYYQYEKTTKNGNKILISGDPEKAAETAKDLGIKYKKGEIGIIVDSEDADIFKRETKIKIKKPASVSVLNKAEGVIPPTVPEKPPETQISGQAGQGVEAPEVKSPTEQLLEDLFNDDGLKIEIISDNGKVVKFIDEKGGTGSYPKAFFESSYKPIKSPTEQLLEAPPAEKNFYEGATNKEGMVELGAGFNPLKPFIENYETVAKPFVKTTEAADAVIRTMDNIAGGKVSQFVNKAFHGETYRDVRKELQVAGQMAHQDIAKVSDYVASTMTGKLNNDLTDLFANTKRAWSGLNVDFNKKVKTIMETLGDYAEIKQGTGVSTKEYTLLDYAGRREEKMVEKAGAVKGRRRVIPENETALNNVGIDTVAFNTLKKLGFIDKYTLKSGGKGVALTQVGKQVADEMIKYSGKTPEELAKFIKKVDRFVAKVNKGQVITLTPEVVESIKKLPNLVDVSPMNIGMDVRKIAKYAPDEKGILRKAQEYSDDEIKRLVDDGYLHEYFNERGEQVYRLTDKGKAVRNEINQASFKDLAIYSDKKAFADVLKKAGINADKDTEEIAHFFVKWFQENTVNLAEKIPMSEKQLQKMKYQWGKYFPKQRATLSETGLRKIMDNPEIYTKEQVELATDIHNSIKNPKVLGVKVVEYRKNLADAIQRNVDLSDDGVKVPRQWQAEAGLPYNPDLKIAADAKDLVETQYLRSWAFNRSNKEFSDLLQAGRVGVKNVDLVNLTSRVMSKKYDAILPYISNPTDVLQGVMSKVTNTLRMNDAFENLAKHTEYVRTDLDPKYHGTSYTDVVDGVGVTYKYINPEQTEYLSLAGKYVNENVLRSIQTRIDGSAQSLSKFSLDSTWSKFLRPIWYAGMTSSNLSYHAINMVTSGVNMLLHAPQLGLRPFSVAKTSLKWFKTLGSPKLRREFADEIQDMIEHQIIGQENIAVNPKSYGTITRGNIGAFEINKTINKVGVTIQEILNMAPAFANMSDQLARITYYQEKINDLKKIMQKADYKALSPEQQADFVAQFKAKAADQAQTIIPSYIDTANALRAVNEVMPLVSWGMKAYKIPYRNLMTLLGKNDIKGFGNLSKSINMTEKAKAAFALIGLPALAGYYAYNKVQTNKEQAMAEAATTPEYRNNFYDQKWCKMIPSIEDLFERQEDYLAAKYVIDAAFNRSFSFETNEGVVKISGSNYGERYRLPEFSSPLVTYGNILFTGTKVNPFTGTGEPITEKEGWERAKDLFTYTLFVSSANSQRYNSEVRRLKKKGMDEKQAKIQAYAKMIDPETLLRYDIITQEDLIKRTRGEHYRLKKQIAGLKKMTPEEQQKAIPGIEKQGERVRVRADLIDYLPKGKEE